MTVFHNLCRDHYDIKAPPFDSARSGYLHTICSVVTEEKISSLRLRLLSQQYLAKFSHRQDLQLLRPQAAPVPPASAGFSPANCTSSISVCRSVVEMDRILSAACVKIGGAFLGEAGAVSANGTASKTPVELSTNLCYRRSRKTGCQLLKVQ